MKLIGISGSLRKASFNTALLNAAVELAPDDMNIQAETLHGIPLYNGDEEDANGIPPRVAELKDAIAASDGVIFATPEYNASIPGVFKNASDWLSRPYDDIARVWGGRKVAIMGATFSGFATISSQNAWLPVLRNIGAQVWTGGGMHVSAAHTVFDENGKLTDEGTRERLVAFLRGFADFVKD